VGLPTAGMTNTGSGGNPVAMPLVGMAKTVRGGTTGTPMDGMITGTGGETIGMIMDGMITGASGEAIGMIMDGTITGANGDNISDGRVWRGVHMGVHDPGKIGQTREPQNKDPRS
jgi:hypothetical protein